METAWIDVWYLYNLQKQPVGVNFVEFMEFDAEVHEAEAILEA